LQDLFFKIFLDFFICKIYFCLNPFEFIRLTREPPDPNPPDPSLRNGSVWTALRYPWIGPGGVFWSEPDRPGPLSTPLIYMNVHKKNLNQGIFPITTIYLQYASLQSEVVVVPNDAS
jgi:hypothetical protein